MKEAGIKNEHVEGKYKRLQRLKAAGEIEEYEIDWNEMWRECARYKMEESVAAGGAPDKVDERVHLPEVFTVTVSPRVPAGPNQGIATSHTHLREVSPVAGVAAAKGSVEPRVLGNVPAQVPRLSAMSGGRSPEIVGNIYRGDTGPRKLRKQSAIQFALEEEDGDHGEELLKMEE